MLRVLKILEVAWLIIGVGSLLMGAYQFNTHGWGPAKWFFGGALIAGVFYGFRRSQRKKFENQQDQNGSK